MSRLTSVYVINVGGWLLYMLNLDALVPESHGCRIGLPTIYHRVLPGLTASHPGSTNAMQYSTAHPLQHSTFYSECRTTSPEWSVKAEVELTPDRFSGPSIGCQSCSESPTRWRQ